MMMMMMNSRRMSLRHKRTRRSRARPLERLQWTRDVHLARVTRARYVPARVCARARARECSSFSSLDLTSEKKTDAKIKEKEAIFVAN